MGSRLNIMDMAFLGLETQRTPVNVASLQIFDRPPAASDDYVREMLAMMRRQKPGRPFNLKLASGGLTRWPQWEVDRRFDIEYHVRHSALPRPGTMEDLLDLASRLHSRLMDRERPLWEFHLIEGLSNGGFAIYTKMHHAAIDGMGGIALLEACLNRTPDEPMKAPWIGLSDSKKGAGKWALPNPGKLVKQLRGQAGVTADLGKLVLGHGLKLVGLRPDYSPPPFIAPQTPFNVHVSAARRFMTQTLPLSSIKQLARETSSTVNDIVLAVCSGALRNYLRDHHKLPKKTLVAMVPVSIHQINRSGNQITYVSAKLATQRRNPITRLAEISRSTRHAKQELAEVSPGAAVGFAVIAQGLVALMNRLHASSLLPPPANVVISNVPGPRRPLYFGGALLRANFPLSVLVDGQALNITVMSYQDSVDFGLMACREAVPDVEVIAAGIAAAFSELQAAAEASKARPGAATKAAGGPSAKSGSGVARASKKTRSKKVTRKAAGKKVAAAGTAGRKTAEASDAPEQKTATPPKTRKSAAKKAAGRPPGKKAAVKKAAARKTGTTKPAKAKKTAVGKATARKSGKRASAKKASAARTSKKKTPAVRKAAGKKPSPARRKTAAGKASPQAVSSSGKPIRSLRERRSG